MSTELSFGWEEDNASMVICNSTNGLPNIPTYVAT